MKTYSSYSCDIKLLDKKFQFYLTIVPLWEHSLCLTDLSIIAENKKIKLLVQIGILLRPTIDSKALALQSWGQLGLKK